jgi:hypothetical protein
MGPKLLPAGIRGALGQVGVLDQVRHPQVFPIDDAVLPHQQQGRLMMKTKRMVSIEPLPLSVCWTGYAPG